jgi:hypothetical protein
MRSFLTLSTLFSAVLCASAAVPSIAEACGGCFAPVPPTPERAQVVTDHRMVLALSQRQTTLWDQIRYTGAPEDFVWVLPVANAGALQIGLADNAFVDAIDAYGSPFVTADLPQCWRRFRTTPRIVDSGVFVGCGSPAMEGGFGAMPGVESTRVGREGEAVVGPYAVNVISTESGGMRLDTWLREHGYDVPASTRTAINHYVDLQFDFIILRLRPGVGIKQMQPVRITTRGYMPMLPLRMIAAGIGDKVGLSLTVIASGRVEAQGYTNAVVDEDDLTFDYATNRSNWRDVYQRALNQRPGRTWVIESVQNVVPAQVTYGGSTPPTMPPPEVMTLDGSSPSDAASADAQPSTPDAMLSADGALVLDVQPIDDDAGPTPDALVWDASDVIGDDALVLGDGSLADTGTITNPDGGTMTMQQWEPYIDRRYAFAGLDGRAVLTRMRAELRFDDLDGDLLLDGASGPLVPVEYVAPTLLNPPPCPRTSSCAVIGATAPLALEALGVVSIVMLVRRRRREKSAR